LGLYRLKSELEDLSLKYLEHDAYYLIKEKLNATKKSRDEYIEKFIRPIDEKLKKAGLKFHMKGRTKSIHSIWQKMKKQHCGVEGIYDLFAIRIILDSALEKEKMECWQVYSIITDMYQPNPKRLRDWLSIPKSNGYESLHITVLGPENKWVEVQIRTERMDEIAERGLAAHWRYKGIKGGESGVDEWLNNIRSALENNDDLQLMDQFKMDLYEDEVFVFTPKGDLFKFPKGATVLDFAYTIHTNVGDHCIGAKINEKNAPLRQKLNSGDQVEILTSKTQRVQKEWINFATTAKAKNKIQAILRREERELQKQGEEMLNEFFEKAEVEPNSMNIDKLCDLHRIKFREELFQAIGSKNVVLGTADLNVLHEKQGNKGNSWTHFIPFLKKKSPSSKTKEKPTPEQPISIDRKKTVVLNEENIQNFIIAECCHPIPGDDVLGYIDSDKHIYIHKRQCPVAAKLKTSDGNHILAATWDVHKTLFFPATIKVSGIDNIGILHEMTGVLSNQLNINIYKLTVSTKDGIFDCEIQLGVHDVEDVKTICNKLKNMTGIEEVTRID
jgi:GTP pyrophosphokinase